MMKEATQEKPLMVTNQPETLILNKYLGFKQLSYLQENGFSCIIPNEIENHTENFLHNDIADALWTIRVATITGRDFDLPAIIGVDKTTALSWMDKQHKQNPNYVFFCSKYFNPIISGRIHIEYFNTRIEMSLGDFSSFKHGIPDLAVTSNFNQDFKRKIDKKLIDKNYVEEVIYLSKRLKYLYKDEFITDSNLLHEYDFAFIPNDISKYDLKLIGMRTYIEQCNKYGNIPPSLLDYFKELYKDELFEID